MLGGSHLLGTGMHSGQLVFAQVMTYLPLKAFSRMVKVRRAQHKVKDFSCLDQFMALSFAQLTAHESLRDIEINLRVQRQHFYHLGFRCKTISRNTLANANRVRPWEVFADLAHHLIGMARPIYANDATSTDLKSLMGATVYALDATPIDLCLSLFSWAPLRTTKAAIKLHTLIDLRASIPSFIHISDGKMHDVKVLDLLAKQGYIEAGAYYVMDKAYVDFARLHQLHTARAFFMTRVKSNMQFVVAQEFPVPINTGLVSDQHIQLTGYATHKRYPELIRQVTYIDPETCKTMEFPVSTMLRIHFMQQWFGLSDPAWKRPCTTWLCFASSRSLMQVLPGCPMIPPS
jgi:hypothetical protein